MADKKKKISELPLAASLAGLFTIGVNAANQSVKVSLEWLKSAADNVLTAISNAGKATTAANTAAGAANDAARNAGAKMVQIEQEANAAIKKANDAAENVQDGKTPVLQIGDVTEGPKAIATITSGGKDESGNPISLLNFVFVRGKDGQPPLITWKVKTGDYDSDVQVEQELTGTSPEGNPLYIVTLTIPRGVPGAAGTGTGNVYVDATRIQAGKKYLLVFDVDGNATGKLIEYVAPEIPEQIPSDWGQTDPNAKDFIKRKPVIPDAYDDSELRTEIANNLAAAKTYTNEQIAGIVQFDIKAVPVLPDAGVKGTIYLVPKTGSGNDVHNEYIWIESKSDYELIGSTDIDLSDYYTKQEVNDNFVAKESKKRLMTDEEGTKLEGIEEGANKFRYPDNPQADQVLTWGENGALWGNLSNGSNPLILGKIYGITSTTDQSVMDAVLNGSSIQNLLDAAITSRPIYVQGITSGDYSVVRSIESREGGRIVITFDMFVSTSSPSYKKIEYVAYIRYNDTTKAIIQIFTIGQILGGFENGSATEIPMNCNNVYASINSSTDISPVLTLSLFGELPQGAETTAIIKNTGSSDLVISGILPDTSNSFFNGKSITLCDPLPDVVPQNNYVELNIKYFNNRFYVRVSPIFEE